MIESRKRPNRGPAILVILVIAVVAVLIWQFVAFQRALGLMPHGWTVAGMPVAEQEPRQVILKLRSAFSESVTLHYQAETFPLPPQEVDFRLDEQATLKALDDARLQVGGGGQGFIYFLIRRTPPPRDVPAVVTFSEEKLRAFLTRAAERYDLPSTSPAPLPDELRFVPGQPGTELDISASVPGIATALRSAIRRQAPLAIKIVPPLPPRIALLHDLLQAHVDRKFDGQAGIYVKDLQTGEELGINEDIAFSGLSLLKLPILTETYRRMGNSPDDATLQLIKQTATAEAGNGPANALLQRLGNGDAYDGGDRIRLSLRYLGLINTFIAVPYDQNVTPPAIVTQANSRTDLSADPDPRMQTTPQDLGLLLEMVYLCSKGGGTFLIAYPDAFTSEKCSQLLDLLSQARLTSPNGSQPMFVRAGLPAETRLANKWGWDNETRANAAIVYMPNRDYVLVILLHRKNWGDWQQASPLMADIARATYSYFSLPR